MWYEFQIETVNKRHEELGIDSAQKARLMVDLSEVCAFYETSHNKEGDPGTNIELRNGESYVVTMIYDDFNKLICK